MSSGRVALRVFLAGAVLKALLIRRAESGSHPTLTRFILGFDPLATRIAEGASGQASNIILMMVFGLECVVLFYLVRWLLSRRKIS
jgi:hypothetical protein